MSSEEAREFTSADDIVHAIARCIQVLESPLADAHEFTKVQALRLLVHFVADVHQPLHCGTGFYRTDGTDTAELITYPGEAFGKPSDRGGNLLFYGTNPTEQLHALWDTVIVEKIDDTADYQALADFLLQNERAQEIAMTSGDYHDWALAWAVESVRIATLAYLAIAFEKAHFNPDKQLIRINIRLPINYLEANQTYTRLQLTKAGVRLAQLLDSIKW
jgi:hypothetical protein